MACCQETRILAFKEPQLLSFLGVRSEDLLSGGNSIKEGRLESSTSSSSFIFYVNFPKDVFFLISSFNPLNSSMSSQGRNLSPF